MLASAASQPTETMHPPIGHPAMTHARGKNEIQAVTSCQPTFYGSLFDTNSTSSILPFHSGSSRLLVEILHRRDRCGINTASNFFLLDSRPAYKRNESNSRISGVYNVPNKKRKRHTRKKPLITLKHFNTVAIKRRNQITRQQE